jgi:hypothetical protein
VDGRRPAGSDMLRRGAGEASWVDTARRPASFDTMRGCYVSEEGIRDMLSWFSEPTGETFKGDEGAPVWWKSPRLSLQAGSMGDVVSVAWGLNGRRRTQAYLVLAHAMLKAALMQQA